MDKKIETLKSWIENSNRIVFLGGAGVSTESGIPDFRGTKGIFNMESDIPYEVLLSHDYFYRYQERFYKFYKSKMIWQNVMPNKAHYALAELERQGKLAAVITQNIDGLHQKAGSKNVIELHGSIERNYCDVCGKKYDLAYIIDSEGVPICSCKGVIRPDVVLYGEQLKERTLEAAVDSITKADLLIVGGTSLVVYPAAGLIRCFNGSRLVIINRDETTYDSKADLVINDPIGEVLGACVDLD